MKAIILARVSTEEQIKMKEKIKTKKEPKIIIQYESDSNFDEEFAEFVEEILIA